MQIYVDHIPDTPIGSIAIAATGRGLLAVEIGLSDPLAWASSLGAGVTLMDGMPFPAGQQIHSYLAGTRTSFDLALDWHLTTPFQQRVLKKVAAIPYGHVRTYVEIARQMDRPGAARAVGRANATNPLTLVVPCHRLIGVDGSLRGYRAPDGIRTKAWLLALEKGVLGQV